VTHREPVPQPPVDLHEPAGETVQVGMDPAAVKLDRMICQDAVGGDVRHRKGGQADGGSPMRPARGPGVTTRRPLLRVVRLAEVGAEGVEFVKRRCDQENGRSAPPAARRAALTALLSGWPGPQSFPSGRPFSPCTSSRGNSVACPGGDSPVPCGLSAPELEWMASSLQTLDQLFIHGEDALQADLLSDTTALAITLGQRA
jgi:hypothetical protein